MKFTEEQAREALRAELTNKGRKSLAMSDRTLAKMTESLTKKLADDEMGLPEFVESALEILNPMNDNIRKDKSDFANKWKEEHPEPEPPADPDQKDSKDDPVNKAYEERIAALEKRLKDNDLKSVLAQKRSDVVSKLKEKGVKDDEWIETFLSEVNITEDFDVEAKAESYVKLYNKTKANGGSPVPPANPNTPPADSAYAQSIKEAAAIAKQRRAMFEDKNN